MRFGLFGGASARRGASQAEIARGYHDFVDTHVEAEALGFHSSFVTEHHFTKIGQISETLTLLTWIAARTRRLRLGTAVIVLPGTTRCCSPNKCLRFHRGFQASRARGFV